MSKRRKWKIEELKELLQQRNQGIITSREICKKLKIKPSSLYTYTTKFGFQKESPGKNLSASGREREIQQLEQKLGIKLKQPLRNLEEQPKHLEGKLPDWMMTGIDGKKIGGFDPLGLRKPKEGLSLPLEIPHLDPRSEEMRRAKGNPKEEEPKIHRDYNYWENAEEVVMSWGDGYATIKKRREK